MTEQVHVVVNETHVVSEQGAARVVVRTVETATAYVSSYVPVPGPTGGQGPAGDPGGPPGPEGPSGQPRYVGDGAPSTIIGAEPGDHYLDRLSGAVYVLG